MVHVPVLKIIWIKKKLQTMVNKKNINHDKIVNVYAAYTCKGLLSRR